MDVCRRAFVNTCMNTCMCTCVLGVPTNTNMKCHEQTLSPLSHLSTLMMLSHWIRWEAVVGPDRARPEAPLEADPPHKALVRSPWWLKASAV